MRIRNENDYTWFPIVEINKLFITIFITMIPVLEMLKAGSEGKLKWITDSVSSDMSYFWITGFLSALLQRPQVEQFFRSRFPARLWPGLTNIGIFKLAEVYLN